VDIGEYEFFEATEIQKHGDLEILAKHEDTLRLEDITTASNTARL
jgi:hypothetical protein